VNDIIAVGTPVTVKKMYGDHGNNELVVLSLGYNKDGYGIGPAGNDPTKAHNSRDGWLYYPASYVTPKEESKAVNKFNKGDKVRFIDKSNTAWFGVEGIVESPDNTYGINTIRLTVAPTGWASNFKVGDEAKISDTYLELIPSFTFKDIQKGDTIRRTEKWDGTGTTKVVEGKVTDVTYAQAVTAEGLVVGYYRDDKNPHMTLELVNRPEPEPVKEAWETAKPGDQLFTTANDGTNRVLTKQVGDLWNTLIVNNSEGKPQKGFTRSTGDIHSLITHDEVKPVFVKA
jgi:hypothetical protein